MKTVAILAGGYAKRMKPVSEDIPKTLVEVAGKPILEWELGWLRSLGYEKFVILGGFLGSKIEDFLKARPDIAQNVRVMIEREPLGTGGAIKSARAELSDEESFTVVNGDSITDMRISRPKLEEGDLGIVCLSRYKIPRGVVKHKGTVITSFVEKPVLRNVWISTGIYILSKKIFDYLPDSGNIEDTTFPKLVTTGKLKCARFEKSYFNTCETIKDVEQITKDIESGLVLKNK
jgi:mannose-1-phosphate guanylyltransferase